MKINAEDRIYSTAAGSLKILQAKHRHRPFTLGEALLTLHSISECCASMQTGLCSSGTKPYYCTFPVLHRDSDSNGRSVQKIAASMLTSSDEQMICALICLREMTRTWLCFSSLWTPARCPGTNLVYHCHLLGLRSTDKHWCQMKSWPRTIVLW